MPMPQEHDVQVHLTPELMVADRLTGSVAVVIDVLRSTTAIVHALGAGCKCIRPCVEVDEARSLADSMRVGRVLLAGERDGVPLPGFDIGNSPEAFTPGLCANSTVVLTTTNGIRALFKAAAASRVMLAAFVNFSAVCEQLRNEARPIHIVCAGHAGEVTLEDTLLAGAVVDFLCEEFDDVKLNDSGRLAWDCFENQGAMLEEALTLSQGGAILHKLGYDEDIRAAARVDRFTLVPELRRDPLRIEIGALGIVSRYWNK
jgi:2-phosphosulfolactate phosphatase